MDKATGVDVEETLQFYETFDGSQIHHRQGRSRAGSGFPVAGGLLCLGFRV